MDLRVDSSIVELLRAGFRAHGWLDGDMYGPEESSRVISGGGGATTSDMSSWEYAGNQDEVCRHPGLHDGQPNHLCLLKDSSQIAQFLYKREGLTVSQLCNSASCVAPYAAASTQSWTK